MGKFNEKFRSRGGQRRRALLGFCASSALLLSCKAEPSKEAQPGSKAPAGDSVSGSEPLPEAATNARAPDRQGPNPQALPADCRDLAPPSSQSTAVFVDAKDPRAQGFDVSSAQGDVPWRTLAQSGIHFVFVRASQGAEIKDRRFEQNWAMAKACGIPRGAYHVFAPTEDEQGQAELFLSMLGEDIGELPPVLDVEISREMAAQGHPGAVFPSPQEYAAKLVTMAEAIEARTSFVPMIYIQPWYWNDYLHGSRELTRYHLWAAGSAPRASEGWMWTFFQRGAHVRWDRRAWDHDVFHGSPEELRTFSQSKGVVGSSAR